MTVPHTLCSPLPISPLLNEMLTPEVGPQIDNLPRTQRDQHAHSTQSKPLDALIRALIGIPQLLLACPQVIHLGDNLANHLLDPAQLCLDRLQLLARRDGIPVLGIGSYVDVELDVARIRRLGGARVHILKAHVESRVGVRGEDVAVLADDVLWFVVVVAHCIANLVGSHVSLREVPAVLFFRRVCECTTWPYVHACQPSGHRPCIRPESP
jgi:hypothetical protein